MAKAEITGVLGRTKLRSRTLASLAFSVKSFFAFEPVNLTGYHALIISFSNRQIVTSVRWVFAEAYRAKSSASPVSHETRRQADRYIGYVQD